MHSISPYCFQLMHLAVSSWFPRHQLFPSGGLGLHTSWATVFRRPIFLSLVWVHTTTTTPAEIAKRRNRRRLSSVWQLFQNARNGQHHGHRHWWQRLKPWPQHRSARRLVCSTSPQGESAVIGSAIASSTISGKKEGKRNGGEIPRRSIRPVALWLNRRQRDPGHSSIAGL